MGSLKFGAYLRLSREDTEHGPVSESIANQRAFLEDYALKHGYHIELYFTDDGWSGTSFERPAFKEMLCAIEAGRINGVLTKDLSRLGRDYIQTGHFVERYFPEHRVRYIAVNDHIDTGLTDSGANEFAPFLSVINDLYAKDISKKVRTALDTKKQNGLFIGSSPPFGYRKDPENRGKLVPDPDTASIVQRLFLLYEKNASIAEAVHIFNKEGIPTPSQRKAAQTNTSYAVQWSGTMIRRILTNPTYAGHLTQNRSQKISYKSKKKISLPPDRWVIVQNTHEAIVAPQTFEKVQEMLQIRTYRHKKRLDHSGHLLSGLVFCAACGSPMTFLTESPSRTYLVCSASRRPKEKRACKSHCIREALVEKALLGAIRSLFQSQLDPDKLAAAVQAPQKQIAQQRVSEAEQALQLNQKALAQLYKDRIRGILSETHFLTLIRELEGERVRLEAQAQALRVQPLHSQAYLHDAVAKLFRLEAIGRGMLLALVKSIRIGTGKQIEITFRFRAPDFPAAIPPENQSLEG